MNALLRISMVLMIVLNTSLATVHAHQGVQGFPHPEQGEANIQAG